MAPTLNTPKITKSEKQRKVKDLKKDLEKARLDGNKEATRIAEAALDDIHMEEADSISDAENDAEPQVKETKPSANKSSRKKEPSLFVPDKNDDDPELVVLGDAPVQSAGADEEDAESEGTIKYRATTYEILRNNKTRQYFAKAVGGSIGLSLSAQRKSSWNTVRPRAIAAVVIAPNGKVDDLVPKFEKKETGSGRFKTVEKFDAHFCQIKTKYDFKNGDGDAGSSWESRSSLKSKWGSAKVTLQEDIRHGDRVLMWKGTQMAKVSRDILMAYIQSHPMDTSSKGFFGQPSDRGKSPSYQPRSPSVEPNKGPSGQSSDRVKSTSYQSSATPDETLNVPTDEQPRNPPKAKHQDSATSIKDENESEEEI